MEEAGISRQGGPIDVMLSEPTTGRSHMRALDKAAKGYKAGDPDAISRIVENARGYVALLTQHIHKEDNVLYPMADRVLSAEKQAALEEGFAAIRRAGAEQRGHIFRKRRPRPDGLIQRAVERLVVWIAREIAPRIVVIQKSRAGIFDLVDKHPPQMSALDDGRAKELPAGKWLEQAANAIKL
ncbi:MAG: hemerythrin domain-containing protein [Anaerolineae bacterium]|nr:hemerythrin domain-containing protein [Anaerolineae bacterium]